MRAATFPAGGGGAPSPLPGLADGPSSCPRWTSPFLIVGHLRPGARQNVIAYAWQDSSRSRAFGAGGAERHPTLSLRARTAIERGGSGAVLPVREVPR